MKTLAPDPYLRSVLSLVNNQINSLGLFPFLYIYDKSSPSGNYKLWESIILKIFKFKENIKSFSEWLIVNERF